MASAETRGKPGLWEVRALQVLGVVLGLYLYPGPRVRSMAGVRTAAFLVGLGLRSVGHR